MWDRPERAFACADCQELKSRVNTLVRLAIRDGVIPPLDGLACVDCGAKADQYEHRDYSAPLSVDPICRACNAKRGIGVMDPAKVRLLVMAGRNRRSARAAEVVAMRKEGHTQAEIGRHFGLTYQRIGQIIRDEQKRAEAGK
jgi:hypothetical protein